MTRPKLSERLKDKLMAMLRKELANWDGPVDVLGQGIVLNLTPQLSSEFEGCVSYWSIRTIGLAADGKVELKGVAHVASEFAGLVDVEEGEEIETFTEADLEVQGVEFLEMVDEILRRLWLERIT